MKNYVVVHGPQGCGKTRNSALLMKLLGATQVMDLDEVADLDALPLGTLLLTSVPQDDSLDYYEVMESCGHGLIRLPYAREFTPCQCGQSLGLAKNTMFEKLLKIIGLQKIPKHEPLGPSAFAALRSRYCKELEELDSLGGGSAQNFPREVVFCGTTKACSDV